MIWYLVGYFARLVALAIGGTFLAVFHIMTASNLTIVPLVIFNVFVFVLLVSSTKTAAIVAFGPPTMNAVLRIEGKEYLLMDYPAWWIPFGIGWLVISIFLPEHL